MIQHTALKESTVNIFEDSVSKYQNNRTAVVIVWTRVLKCLIDLHNAFN